MDVLARLFSDAGGHLSLNRAMTASIVAIVMVTWAITCIRSGELVDIGTNNMALVGIAVTGKVVQRGLEK